MIASGATQSGDRRAVCDYRWDGKEPIFITFLASSMPELNDAVAQARKKGLIP